MMRTSAIFIFFCLSNCFFLQAQADKCGVNKLDSIKQAEDPNYLKRKESYYQEISKIRSSAKTALEIIRIPVVVHVIHNDSSNTVSDDPITGNISLEQIESQITVLNEDFRRIFGTPGYNIHPDGADLEIEFCLANRDPNGLLTDGVTRHFINKASYDLNDDRFIKGVEHWAPQNYLNIYTVPRLDNNFLGYANFPFEAANNPELDGIVVANRFFGDLVGTAKFGIPYDRGRTLTHEVGHWLGLVHIWGDGGCSVDDGCDDTPRSSSGNTRCDTTAFKCESFDMVRNYMDYSDDLCFNIFTKCQKDIARRVFNKPFPEGKLEFIESEGEFCSDTPTVKPRIPDNRIRVIDGQNAKYALAGLPVNQVYEIVIYDVRGKLVKKENIVVDANGLLNFNLSSQRAGLYIMRINYSDGDTKQFKIYGPLR
jgi:hypothetical protein